MGRGATMAATFDTFNLTSHLITRGLTAAQAATALGVPEQELTDGVAAASFLDANGLRCTGTFNIWGDDYEYRWFAKRLSVGGGMGRPVVWCSWNLQKCALLGAGMAMQAPVIGVPTLE